MQSRLSQIGEGRRSIRTNSRFVISRANLSRMENLVDTRNSSLAWLAPADEDEAGACPILTSFRGTIYCWRRMEAVHISCSHCCSTEMPRECVVEMDRSVICRCSTNFVPSRSQHSVQHIDESILWTLDNCADCVDRRTDG